MMASSGNHTGIRVDHVKRDITEVLGEEEVRQVIQKLLQPPQETKEALATATQNVPLFLRVIRTYYSNQGSSSGKHQQTNTTAEASKRAEKVINQVTEERSLDGHQKAAAMQGVLYVLQRLAYNDANQNLAKEICGEIGLPESYKEAIAAEWLEHRSNVMKLLRDREANFSENTSSTVATSHVNLDLDSLFSQQSRKDCLESLLTVTGEDGTEHHLVLKETEMQQLLGVLDDIQSQLDIL